MLDIIGLPVQSLTKKLGKPMRLEASGYGFQWHVYGKNLKKYLLAGVDSGIVVAAYSNSKQLAFRGIRFNAARDAVRASLGKPLAHIRRDNVVYIINEADRKDYFDIGGHFAVVFYDILAGKGVTSMLIVPKAAEISALIDRAPLSAEALQAYQRISADLVNAARARAGLGKLAADTRLGKLAAARTADMRDRDYFSHVNPDKKNPFDLARAAGIRFKSMGENIAYGHHSPIFAHESFMNSTGHRNNILKKVYRKLGTGVAAGGSRYVLLAQEFIR